MSMGDGCCAKEVGKKGWMHFMITLLLWGAGMWMIYHPMASMSVAVVMIMKVIVSVLFVYVLYVGWLMAKKMFSSNK